MGEVPLYTPHSHTGPVHPELLPGLWRGASRERLGPNPQPSTLNPQPSTLNPSCAGIVEAVHLKNVDIRLSGKGNSNSHGARPVC